MSDKRSLPDRDDIKCIECGKYTRHQRWQDAGGTLHKRCKVCGKVSEGG